MDTNKQRNVSHLCYLIIIVLLSLALASKFDPAAIEAAAPTMPTPAQIGSMSAPAFLSYQGTLRDQEGKLLTGPYTLTFRIYDGPAPTGALLWEEQHPDVTVRNGYFSVLLGDRNALPSNIFDQTDRFIGITLKDYDEMVPRQRFTSVPYAISATNAVSATNAINATNATRADLATRAYTLSAADGSPAQQVYVDNNGAVGIGTRSPMANLHVLGSRMRLESAGRKFDLRISPTDVALETATSNLYIRSIDHNVFINPFSNEGNVGIGTRDPKAKLDVNGALRVKGVPLVLIKRFENKGNDADFDTDISEKEYECVAAGWSARYEVNDNNSESNNMVWTYVRGSTWWLRVSLSSEDRHENPDVDVLCFRKEIASWKGASRGLNDPD